MAKKNNNIFFDHDQADRKGIITFIVIHTDEEKNIQAFPTGIVGLQLASCPEAFIFARTGSLTAVGRDTMAEVSNSSTHWAKI